MRMKGQKRDGKPVSRDTYAKIAGKKRESPSNNIIMRIVSIKYNNENRIAFSAAESHPSHHFSIDITLVVYVKIFSFPEEFR